MTDHADIVREALHSLGEALRPVPREAKDMRGQALAALDRIVAERDEALRRTTSLADEAVNECLRAEAAEAEGERLRIDARLAGSHIAWCIGFVQTLNEGIYDGLHLKLREARAALADRETA